MIRLFLLALLLVVPIAEAGKVKRPVCNAFGWCTAGSLPSNFQGGAYTPLTVTNGAVQIFGNNWSSGFGEWNEQHGTWTTLTNPVTVIRAEDVYDEPCTGYCVRTSAVQRLSTGGCVGMLMVGNGYPTTDSYRPAWAMSEDCTQWVYRGRILIEGSFAGYGQTDSGAMVVNEAASAMPDHASPLDNRYVIFVNYQDLEGLQTKLLAVYSADAVSWWRGRDAFGKLIDYWPGEYLSFPTATRTPYGIHIIAGNQWPATVHRHLFRPNGASGFCLIESNAMTNTGGGKGTNAAFDSATGTIHALTDGVHFTLLAQDWGC